MTATTCPIHSWCARPHRDGDPQPGEHLGQLHYIHGVGGPNEPAPHLALELTGRDSEEPRLYVGGDLELTLSAVEQLLDVLGGLAASMRAEQMAATR